MKKLLILSLSITSAALALGLLATASADIQTQPEREQAMEHKFEKAKQYYAECQNVSDQDFEDIRPYLKAFTDVEVMADTMANPVQFAKFFQVINDPRTMHVMMKCSTEPVMWVLDARAFRPEQAHECSNAFHESNGVLQLGNGTDESTDVRPDDGNDESEILRELGQCHGQSSVL